MKQKEQQQIKQNQMKQQQQEQQIKQENIEQIKKQQQIQQKQKQNDIYNINNNNHNSTIKQNINYNNNIKHNKNNEVWYIKNKFVLKCDNCGQLRDLRFYDIEWKEYQQFKNNPEKEFYCEFYDDRQPSATISEVE